MTSAGLTPLVYVATVLSWISTVALIQLARLPNPPQSLTERAWAAIILSLFLSVLAVTLRNVDLAYAWFDVETGRIATRLGAIALGAIPVLWLYRYWRGFRR